MKIQEVKVWAVWEERVWAAVVIVAAVCELEHHLMVRASGLLKEEVST